MFGTSAEILQHFAGHLALVHGVADFHRIEVAAIRRDKARSRSSWKVNYQNLIRTAAVTAEKCMIPIWQQGLAFVAKRHGLDLVAPAWQPIDGELLALSIELCADCAAKPPAPARRPGASTGSRAQFYFWLDSYINDMRAAAQIVKSYLDAAERLAGDALADDLWEPIKKTEALLIHAASCTAENTMREHDQHSRARNKPAIGEHLKLYTPRPLPAAWFGLRPQRLCKDCAAAIIPQRIKTM